MGHTHYNEISNNGKTIYSATRSTGQIEEGPVGFSLTNLDGDVVSWRFFEPGKQPFVIITSPGDERLLSDSLNHPQLPQHLRIRAKVWSQAELKQVEAVLGNKLLEMRKLGQSSVWETLIETHGIPDGSCSLRVNVLDAEGNTGEDEILVPLNISPTYERAQRDQDNALKEWPEHGLLGTQLGPNKNGRKW